ncbi:MAG: folylpolyglutamate synthase/dihydrofolate synthase family protein [Pseudomonadota bacterium]
MGLHPKIIDLTLDRVWRLLGRMGDPQDRLPPVIHVAGTNGKGSTVAMLRAGLEGAGQRVHAYTSPHLVRFHERIRLAGTLIDEASLMALLERCEAANGPEQITYFEITTVAALVAMAETAADWTLLEVGLGGRLDATNVVTPRLSVITMIGMDHEAFLGDTIEAIATEKAGIMKPGVPVVIGHQPRAEALDVLIARAEAVGAPSHVAGRDWHVAVSGKALTFEMGTTRLTLPRPALPGDHQVLNAGAALAALTLLGEGDPAAAMTGVTWPARLQQLDTGPLAEAMPQGVTLWLDGGHNPAAADALVSHFEPRKGGDRRRLHLVAGMLDTKDATRFAAPLAPLVRSAATVTIPDAPASLSASALSAVFDGAGIAARPAPSVEAALAAVLADARPGDDVLICGSLYLAGHVLGL